MELRCSRALALLLGAINPESIEEHRQMKKAGHLLIRDEAGSPLFWPWSLDRLTSILRQHK